MFNYCHFRNCGGVWDRQEGQFDFSQGGEFNELELVLISLLESNGASRANLAGSNRAVTSFMSLGTPRLNRAMNRACWVGERGPAGECEPECHLRGLSPASAMDVITVGGNG
jgi:hypothetical protein